jgi:hypothetical protein
LLAPKTGTNAWLNAPSANNRLNIFGSRNATLNASVIAEAPNIAAINWSRTMPVMRDTNVSAEMTEADLRRDMGIEFSDLIQLCCSRQKLDLAGFRRFIGNLAHFTP